MGWMEQAPIWIVGLIMVAGLALVHELGARAGRRLPSAIDDGEGRAYLVSSALALLGLMLAFTFGAAEQRFNVRQRLVVDESNAMGTAYLRILYDRYGYPFFFAAYNAGPGRLEAHLRRGRTLPAETRAYIKGAVRVVAETCAEKKKSLLTALAKLSPIQPAMAAEGCVKAKL